MTTPLQPPEIWDPTAPAIKILEFDPLRDLLRAGGCPFNVEVLQGPELPDTPNPYVLLTFYGGVGFTTAGAFDRQTLQARCVGFQLNPSSARELAMRVDSLLTDIHSVRLGVGPSAPWCLEIARVGGGPTALLVDDADRTHYTCNYAIEVESNG